MDAKVRKIFNRSCSQLTLIVGLFLFFGCSEQTASKPDQITAQQQVQAEKAQTKEQLSKGTPTKPSQTSSLDALQKGTLGKGVDKGPLQDVAFDFDRYDLNPPAREILKGHAAWLKANPQARVEVEGHCDERGTNEYNLALGAKRAESVKRYLIDLGVSPSRLSTISYGEEIPLCKDQNEVCWAKNRRAHFFVKSAPTT